MWRDANGTLKLSRPTLLYSLCPWLATPHVKREQGPWHDKKEATSAMLIYQSRVNNYKMLRKAMVVPLIAAAMIPSSAADQTKLKTKNDGSYLQINSPEYLTQDGGYHYLPALFGPLLYGQTIIENIYYADSNLCNKNVDTSIGYPIRETDPNSGRMLPWPTPFILMIDRGGCTFVNKVRHAQQVNASAVIIADNTCLCSAKDSCVLEPGFDCEVRLPIMADDGSASDITIPSLLMFKQDADMIKAEVRENNHVIVEISRDLPMSYRDKVEYEIWMTPMNVVSTDFLLEFKPTAHALSDIAQFTPQMYIYDGIRSGCQGIDGENQCYNLCTNNGRYCATDPDNDLDSSISGADVIIESLRRMCIWEKYGDDGFGVEWWKYVTEFSTRCDEEINECPYDVMVYTNISGTQIDQCMENSGGTENNVKNALLEKQLERQTQLGGPGIIPTIYVNGILVRSEASAVLNTICDTLPNEALPICIDGQIVSTESDAPNITTSTAKQPSSSPIKLPDTFTLYEIPTFFLAIVMSRELNAELNNMVLEEVDYVVELYLTHLFTNSTGVQDSVYIPALELAIHNATNFESRDGHPGKSVVIQINGIVGIQDGISTEADIIEFVIPSTMQLAFQSESSLVDLFQSVGGPVVDSIANATVCHNTICEAVYSPVDVQMPSSTEEGSKTLATERSISKSGLDAGSYAILAIMGVGLILTISIVVYKHKRKGSNTT